MTHYTTQVFTRGFITKYDLFELIEAEPTPMVAATPVTPALPPVRPVRVRSEPMCIRGYVKKYTFLVLINICRTSGQ